jgi:TonB-linked SusC/RagA family outer membrane protein
LKFARHFTFRTSLGGDFGQAELLNYTPVYVATLKQRNVTSTLNMSRTETRNWILENTLTFDQRFNEHNIKVLVGQSAQRDRSYGFNGSAKNVPNSSSGDHFLTLGDDASRNVSDFGDLATFTSYFARANYSFRDKYLINASIRADGSSKFYGDDRWGYFPSIGAGWVISNEDFMSGQTIFSNLKLRGSWGKIGNGNVPSSIPVQRLTQYPLAFFGPNQNNSFTTFSVATVVPERLGWEKGVGSDIGLEASFLKNKLYFEADYYNRKTENAIFAIPILISLGLGGTLEGNQATIQNKGYEFTATWRDAPKNDFSYSIGANIGINDNKVLDVTTGANPIFGGGGAATGGQLATRTQKGRPIGEFYGLQVAGVFQSQAEITGSAQSSDAKPGDFRYIDQNKDGVIDGKDYVPLGNPNARINYGINTNWNYKNFDLTIDLQGVSGVDVYNANQGIRFGNENFSKDFFDNRWHGAGTSNDYPSANIGGGRNYLPNSYFVEDGSYLRIRNLQLGYTLGNNLANRWKMKSLRVFVNAQNAFNFFKYKGFSPEIIGGSAIDRGIDTNVYPLYATYNFGVNVNF